ncbi:unnamed protein product [Polarella glacialis]|uniref:B box-type domain-containing protein n=1 Tax=Polarella glacialis TaxID=89957 RepID=A0A813H3A1_POLGL|nr:unnamed protein product [Polarella glacialis]CAE8703005.1 unnamed protein product [Polarella glacialis]
MESSCVPCMPGGRKKKQPAQAQVIGVQDVTVEGQYEHFSTEGPRCSICSDLAATRECNKCSSLMCAECDRMMHSKGVMKKHDVVDDYPPKGDNASAATADSKKLSHSEEVRNYLTRNDKIKAGIVAFISFTIIIAMCIWSSEGLMDEHKMVHAIGTMTRPGHMHGTLYSTPADVVLHGTQNEYWEVRMIAMSTKDYSLASHRRLSMSERVLRSLRRSSLSTRTSRFLQSDAAADPHAADPHSTDNQTTNHSMDNQTITASDHAALPPHAESADHSELSHAVGHKTIVGNLTYTLVADGVEFFTKTIQMADDEEYEEFQGVDLADAAANAKGTYRVIVTSQRSDGQEMAFVLQVVQMGGSGKYRELIGAIIFVITFIGIISEKIHRVYSAMLGSAAAICTVSAIQETVHLSTVTSMVDFGTLMLLFSMMILMRMLQETGFFNWFAVKVVRGSKQNPKILFFAMTNICGFLSMFLDNVTCVLLFGPLTYSLSRQMQLNPRPIYLSMAICATVGGTGTLIGDPPNIVIASKMKVGFETFLAYNFPIIAFCCLPLASAYLYWRFKDSIVKDPENRTLLDLDQLDKENEITDMPKFTQLMGILFAVFIALLLSPVHKIEPSWFTVMAMWGAAILFRPHNIHHYLEAVEWDTLFFFALLFVLVESLSELGVIKMLGTTVAGLIMSFPEESRTVMGIIIILWVAAFGSAFLESLPFTTTIVYILLDMQQQSTPGLDPEVLVWPLSCGACIGGIGSIMGSSANLVSMAVSSRQAQIEDEKIQGVDFLKYGLPTMIMLIAIVMCWQLLIFVAIGAPPN